MEIYEGKNDLQDELEKTICVSGYGTKESTQEGTNNYLTYTLQRGNTYEYNKKRNKHNWTNVGKRRIYLP